MPNLPTTMTRILAISVNGAVLPAFKMRHTTLYNPVATVCRAGLAQHPCRSEASCSNLWGAEVELDPTRERTSFLRRMKGCPMAVGSGHVSFHRRM